MPKLTTEQKLQNRLQPLGCKIVDHKIYCNCGAWLKVSWGRLEETAKDLAHFHGLDAETELFESVVHCVEYLLFHHQNHCNVRRRGA